MRSVVAKKTENHCADAVAWQEESLLRTHRRQFMRQNVFGLCIRLWALHRSVKLKWDSNAVSGCWENWLLEQTGPAGHKLSMSTVFLSFLDNHRPLLSPVSISLTDSTPISLCKGRKHFASQIGYDDFRGGSPLLIMACCAWLSMSIVILSFLYNHLPI